ncbi:outer membrane protein assembly factor BamA [Rhodobacteraceae bacterium HSP-20]|uniref:Outer membrane protein assembly factor BamA n=1 Tax=Paragemmobacter amnigenus TaxID=2852097 RepID=A0ABS6IXY1_9RHOB|nr:outer membrane protein assembly factor BamA [Rhodobacter amnigenus]MBU9696371.1 outer membrane protein assembly factor BamA [Rhodobacter amnigenus]MBV4387598.1 outer membrane protein assembly factor BamA [Rhodobacter amnigenus]
MRKTAGRIGKSENGLVRPALIAAFLGSVAIAAPVVGPAFAQTYSFSSVQVEGNSAIEPATIIAYAGIGRGEEVTAARLNDAYQNIVNSGLFESVELEPQGNTLVIRVVEYPMINIVNFEGNSRLKDEELAEIAKSRGRLVYSPSQAEEDAAAIADAYRLRGRIAATVDPRIIRRDGNRVDLVFEVTEGKVAEIERLSFVGNRAFSDRRLRQVLETKQAGLLRQVIQRDTFVAERLELDKQLLRDFYLARGYADVQVLDATSDVSRERDAFFVTITIREGQQFRIGQTSTVSEIEGVDAAEFEAVQRIRSGEVWSPALIDNNVTRMENLALRKGLNFVRVDPRITRDERGGLLDVEFAIVRGERIFVERIDIEGNTTTLDQVVRRQFRTVEGDPFNAREIRQSAERIRALGFFADAQVNAEPGSSSDSVVVNVDVEEQPTGSLTFGASYGVEAGIGFNIGLSEKNFLGRGQSVGLSLTTGADATEGSFSFTEPAFLGRDLAWSFGVSYRESDNANSASYDTRVGRLTTGLEFPLGELSRLQVRYTYQDSKISNPPAGVSPIIAAEVAQGAVTSSALGYTYSYDSRISGLNPKGGVLLRFSQDFAGLGGDSKYIMTTGLALAETKVMQEEVTLRTIFEGGMINSLGGTNSRVTERFFGNSKIRGFESNGIGPRDGTEALGGNMFAVARFEADFPVGLPEEYGISGGLFMDVGSVWSLDNTLGSGGVNVDDSMNIRSAAGFSVFWDTPVGPLRLNFSKALAKEDYDREQSFDLTISTKF